MGAVPRRGRPTAGEESFMSTGPTSTGSTMTGTHGSKPMTTNNALISDYLDRLRRASAGLPEKARAELLDDINAHLAETVGAAAGEAEIRRVLDDLGAP